ncbi:MAG: hypothetical protein FMNOHCHN_01843 [Ignavibacteriaceae bacterium]|nr:hypothetical protein [Ignavibacteriaceae bacterium]
MHKWFEIFRTGKHTDSAGRTKEWTEADLDKIVSSYNPAQHEAPIVIGHPKDDAPAYGWIQALKRSGDRLLALPSRLLPLFTEAVKNGFFKKRSVALNPDGSLRHVGFLGAASPAVKGLADPQFNDAPADAHIYEYQEHNASDEFRKQLEELRALNDKLEQMLKNETASKTKLEEELGRIKEEYTFSGLNTFLDAKIDEGVITPAQKEDLQQIGAMLFEKEGVPKLMEFVSALPKQVTFGEIAVKPEQPRAASDIMADEIRKRTLSPR